VYRLDWALDSVYGPRGRQRGWTRLKRCDTNDFGTPNPQQEKRKFEATPRRKLC